MRELFEQDLKVGDLVTYSGLGSDREGLIIKRSKRKISIKLNFSTVHLTFVPNVPASDLGLKKITVSQST